jgi:acyl dehydratase
MELKSSFVGAKCRPVEVAVSPRWSMNYAAATGDPNPWYFDDEREGGTIAPPMLAAALTWQISEEVHRHWDSEGFPAEVMAQKVHYSEVLEWLRPMVAGEKLRIEGQVEAILPHRAGTHMILRYDAYDSRNELVFVEHAGAMLRDVECIGGAKGADAPPPAPKRAPKQDKRWEATLPIDSMAAHVYDGCTNMHFPIHTSKAFAHKVGLPDILYQGTATLSLAVRELTDREAEGDPRRLCGVRCNFTGMVSPGTEITIHAQGRVEDESGRSHVHFAVFNQAGQRALHRGCISLNP